LNIQLKLFYLEAKALLLRHICLQPISPGSLSSMSTHAVVSYDTYIDKAKENEPKLEEDTKILFAQRETLFQPHRQIYAHEYDKAFVAGKYFKVQCSYASFHFAPID
jgi:hypothetical protein